MPTHRPSYFFRPVEEREIVRHKSWAPHEQTVDEAASDLEALDYTFHLFHELVTGQDSVIFLENDGALRLMQRRPDLAALEHFATPVSLAAHTAAQLPLDKAVERLHSDDEAFVFFVDPVDDASRVLYWRDDGNYGLITATDGPSS